MASALVFVLFFARDDVFTSAAQVVITLLFLAAVPALAYPLSAIVPAIKKKGRAGQRSLAMYLSAVSYLGAWLYGMLGGCGRPLRLILSTYLFSVIILLVMNKIFHLKASGHACSVGGPIIAMCFYINAWGMIAFWLVIYFVIFLASVLSGGHTPKEYLSGTAASGAAFALAALFTAIV